MFIQEPTSIKDFRVAIEFKLISLFSIDYDYDEDYYYYDEIHNSGELSADLKVNSVDEDYDSSFYYYSDDGEEPEYHSFDQSTEHETGKQSKSPLRNVDTKQKVVVTEDYYYYDEQDNSVAYQQQNKQKSPSVVSSATPHRCVLSTFCLAKLCYEF